MHQSGRCTMNGASQGGLGLRWYLGVYFCQFYPKGSQKLGVETFLPFPQAPCSQSSWLRGSRRQTDWSRHERYSSTGSNTAHLNNF